jgi:hypothetical protein
LTRRREYRIARDAPAFPKLPRHALRGEECSSRNGSSADEDCVALLGGLLMNPRTQLSVVELDARELPSATIPALPNLTPFLSASPVVGQISNAVAGQGSIPNLTNAIISTSSIGTVFQSAPPVIGHISNALAGFPPSNPVVPGAYTVAQLTTYNLNGTANLAGVGAVHITGTIHSVGFVLTGQATGQITISNAQGSVTLALTGPVQAGFSPLPQVFSFKQVSHTGTFPFPAQGMLGLALPPQIPGLPPQGTGTFVVVV